PPAAAGQGRQRAGERLARHHPRRPGLDQRHADPAAHRARTGRLASGERGLRRAGRFRVRRAGGPGPAARAGGTGAAGRTAGERRGYEAVVAGVRARMIVALWDELSPAARGVARALLDRGIPGLAEAEAGGELADLLEPAGHPLVPVLRCAFEADSPGIDLDRARAVLRTHGTDLDPREDLVLATSMRLAPRRTGS